MNNQRKIEKINIKKLTGEFAIRNRKCKHFNIFSIVSLFFIILLQY
jgi:hypothetical protein